MNTVDQGIEAREFKNIRIIGSGKQFEDFKFSHVQFLSCVLAQWDESPRKLVIKNVVIRDCKAVHPIIQGVLFEDSTIDNLAITPVLQFYACLFRHVILKGKIGPVVTVPPHSALSQAKEKEILQDMIDFYHSVDWALDISEAEFIDADFYYIPGELIRRDSVTQFLLRRRDFEKVDIGQFPPFARIAISRFQVSPFDSLVAIAPKRSKDFEKILGDLTYLRTQGLAT